MYMMSQDQIMAMQLAVEVWDDTYFSYYGGQSMNGNYYPANYGMEINYVPKAQASEEGTWVTFNDYIPYGWVGYCS